MSPSELKKVLEKKKKKLFSLLKPLFRICPIPKKGYIWNRKTIDDFQYG